MQEKTYTIEKLSEFTGFSRRTIRYYISEGLLEPPAGRGRGGFYYDSHLTVLQQIRALQEKGMKLAAIQEHFQKRPGEQPVSAREVWVKYPLSEGIEIHVQREFEEKEGGLVLEIIRVVQSILNSRDR
jgi:DNA-binding transcriptional MerR regulator